MRPAKKRGASRLEALTLASEALAPVPAGQEHREVLRASAAAAIRAAGGVVAPHAQVLAAAAAANAAGPMPQHFPRPAFQPSQAPPMMPVAQPGPLLVGKGGPRGASLATLSDDQLEYRATVLHRMFTVDPFRFIADREALAQTLIEQRNRFLI